MLGGRAKAATRIEDRPIRGWPMVLFLFVVLGILAGIAVLAPPSDAGTMRKESLPAGHSGGPQGG